MSDGADQLPTLPLTVTDVSYAGKGLYAVTVVLADASELQYVIPATLATTEAVTISAVAMAQLLDRSRPFVNTHHRGRHRYDPRL